MRADCLVMAKPGGPRCDLRCAYCYYLPKTRLFPGAAPMDEALLERYIQQRLEASPGPSTHFEWHGGEPLLLGAGLLPAHRGTAAEAQARRADHHQRDPDQRPPRGRGLGRVPGRGRLLRGPEPGRARRVPRPLPPHRRGRADSGGRGGVLPPARAAGRPRRRAVRAPRGERGPTPGGLPLLPGAGRHPPAVPPPGGTGREGCQRGDGFAGSPGRVPVPGLRRMDRPRPGPGGRPVLRRGAPSAQPAAPRPLRLPGDLRRRGGPGARRQHLRLRPLRGRGAPPGEHPGSAPGRARGPACPGGLRPAQAGRPSRGSAAPATSSPCATAAVPRTASPRPPAGSRD